MHKEKNVSISLDIEKSLLEEQQEKGNYYNNTPVIIVIIINIRDTKVFFNWKVEIPKHKIIAKGLSLIGGKV